MNEKGKVIFIHREDVCDRIVGAGIGPEGGTGDYAEDGADRLRTGFGRHRDAPEATGDSLHGGRPRGADLPLYLLVSLLAAHGGRARRERTGYGGCYGGDTPFAGVL